MQDKKLFLDAKKLRGQETKLRLDGFYYSNYSSKSKPDIEMIQGILLYQDGFLQIAGPYDGITNSYCVEEKSQNENSYVNAVAKFQAHLAYLKHSNSRIPSSCKFIANDTDRKGLYKIKGDSIQIQYYLAEMVNKNSLSHNSYYLHEYRGVILSNDKFQITQKIDYRNKSIESIDLLFQFRADNNKPDIKNIF